MKTCKNCLMYSNQVVHKHPNAPNFTVGECTLTKKPQQPDILCSIRMIKRCGERTFCIKGTCCCELTGF